jgi:hypothetical protein
LLGMNQQCPDMFFQPHCSWCPPCCCSIDWLTHLFVCHCQKACSKEEQVSLMNQERNRKVENNRIQNLLCVCLQRMICKCSLRTDKAICENIAIFFLCFFLSGHGCTGFVILDSWFHSWKSVVIRAGD